MRHAPFLLVAALVLAGCATEPAAPSAAPATTSPAATTPTIAATPVSPTPAASPASPTSSASPRLGTLYERTFDFSGNKNETRERFEVDRGVERLTLYVESAGPPEDGSFTSAVMDLYPPGYTSPLFAELAGQQEHNYTREMYAEGFWGTWMVRYAGEGKTSVTLRVTAT